MTLPSGNGLGQAAFDEALRDNVRTSVPDRVAFRCDFPAWRGTRTGRHRRLIDDLMLGGRTLEVARRHGLSPSRVSQLRREFHADWLAFCDGPAVRSAVATPHGFGAPTTGR
jgi:hypothetical protein